jgi:hypothetical protein
MAQGLQVPHPGFGSGDSESGLQSQSYQYTALQEQKKAIEDMLNSYKNPAAGFGGFGYSTTSGNIFPKQLGQGYQQAAGFILGGSQGAQEQLRQQYESMLRARTGGAALAYGNAMQQGGGSLAGQGVSPQLARLLLGGQRSSLLGQMSQGIGQDESAYHSALAELMKGTGTELAGLKQNEVGSALDYLTGQKAISASKPSGLTELTNLLSAGAGIAKLF